jgi:prefoldin subunit 5
LEGNEDMILDDVVPIDLNAADVDTLCLLPGIGYALARRIIVARSFETIDDLTRVRGVGLAAVRRWRPFLTVPSTSELDLSEADGVPSEVEYVEAKVLPAERAEEAESGETEVEPVERAAEAEGDEAEVIPAERAEEAESGETEVEPVERAAEAEGDTQAAGEERPLLPEALPDAARGRRRPAVTRSYVGWLVAISGLLVLVLSLLLSLGILATLNGSQLQFASPAQISALAVRIEGLEAQADSLGQDVDGLRTRLTNLEAMGERMRVVEQAAEGLRSDVDAVTSDVADLSTQVGTVEADLSTASEQLDDLQREVGTLREQSGQFQKFLDGLQALMDSLFRSEGGQ